MPESEEDDPEPAKERARPLRVAVIGRPNVGKSTLINRLLGFERSVVDSTPGTTRDSLDTPFELLGEPGVLVDTAGIRRKARIDDRIEQFSVQRSLRAVDRGDLIIHVIDGPEGVTDQDAQILSYAVQRGKALVLAVNKWDLVSPSDAARRNIARKSITGFPFWTLRRSHLFRPPRATAYESCCRQRLVVQAYRRKVSTSALNQALQKIVRAHTPPLSQGRAVKFYYGTQTRTSPPTFALFVNRPGARKGKLQKILDPSAA